MGTGLSADGREVSLVIPGRCKPNSSPVFNKRMNRFFTPKDVTRERNRIRKSFLKILAGHKTWRKPHAVKAEILYRFRPEKAKKQKIGDPCTVRIDLDNLMKLMGDSLNGIVYEDDSMICDLHLRKEFADREDVDVKLTFIPCDRTPVLAIKRVRIDSETWEWTGELGRIGTAYKRDGGYFLLHENGEMIGLCDSLKECKMELEERGYT